MVIVQAEACFPFATEKTDVIPVMHLAWKESFAVVVRNKKAIAKRGWSALNFILLDHPELKKLQDITNGVDNAYQHLALTGMVPINLSDLNTSNSMAGTLMEKLVDRKSYERARDIDCSNNAAACADHALQKMLDASRLPAGLIVSAGHHKLGRMALEKVQQCVKVRRQKEVESVRKKEEEEERLRQKVLAVHQKEEASWNQQDIRTMVSWFKCPGDSKLL